MTEFTTDHHLMTALMKAAAEAATKDRSRPTLMLTQVALHEGGIEVVATDSYRLLTMWVRDAKEPLARPDDPPTTPEVLLDPVHLAKFLAVTAASHPGDVTISFDRPTDGDVVLTTTSGASLRWPQATARFPWWRQLRQPAGPLPEEAVAFSVQYLAALERIMRILRAGTAVKVSGLGGVRPVAFSFASHHWVHSIEAEYLLMPVRVL